MSSDRDDSHAQLSWKTRWVLRRNRILGSGAFQQWAAKTPIFRTIARRKAAHQFDLIAGFVYTQIVHVYVRAGLIGYLREAPRREKDIAIFAELGEQATDRLLRAGAALDLVESPQPGLWTLGQTGAELSANEGAMAMIRHHELLYGDMADPMALLGQPGGENSSLSQFWTYAASGEADDRDSRPYSDLMAATQPMVWQQILPKYDFGQHRRMLDIGGGSGAFAEAVAGIAPNLELAIFDLPDVVPLAQSRFAGSLLETRVAVHPGSFRHDPIPQGHDLVTLVRILHDHDDPVVSALLPRIYQALPAGGRLLIVEPMAGTRGAEPMGDAYFGFYLWAMGSGRPRSVAENRQLLEKAGFSAIREIATDLPIIARALVAIK
tara:strand:- start:1375 stop:2511 length:1137 start_codon:yes stop_codon:yes gene_type:complete